MNRLGFLDDEVELLSRDYAELTSDIIVDFFMSHFFDIKGTDTSNCYMQLNVLENYRKKLPPLPISFACTDKSYHFFTFLFDVFYSRAYAY